MLLTGCSEDTSVPDDANGVEDALDATDAGHDAGTPDGAADADGAADSGVDAGQDAGVDAGGDDAGEEDAGSEDAGNEDAGADDAGDEGADFDEDAGEDAGMDAGTPDGAAPDGTADGAADDGDNQMITGCIEGVFMPYFGVLHSHTAHSDGEDTPAVAFEYARTQAGLDIMLISDHLEQLYMLNGEPAEDWDECRQDADAAYVPGEYLTGCGYEYGSGFNLIFQSTGHNNVYFIDYLFRAIQLDFHDFYQSVVECPDCIVQFDHPMDEGAQHWDNWEYFPDVDIKMNLYEFNGAGPVWDLFFEALDAGWHVAPQYNQDNHGADWGTKNDRRSGFYLSELTREALHQAMRERRGFMTYDKNASLRLMGDGSCWMGSILDGYSSLTVEALADDPDAGDGYSSLELYGPGQTLLDSVDCAGQQTCSISYSVTVTNPTYVLARANQADGDFLVSAPIWVEP